MITGAMDMGDRVRPFRGSRYPGVGNSGFRRKLFERYGNFNTALGRSGSNPLGGEEKDFFMRMRSQGIRYYFVPGAAIRHITPASKLSEEYFERLTRMIGVSERIRTLGEGKSTFRRRLLAEAVKWTGDQRTLPDPDAAKHHAGTVAGNAAGRAGRMIRIAGRTTGERGVKISEASRRRRPTRPSPHASESG